ncbi:ASCH domain-containing protein [Caldanaerobacter subterraneus]|uniref:ASCH domain-containing protein n=1 Tax=Caldanaerobacter subterraneus TaxID=911092 RepID=A0A7Y2L9E8_9THEO|nr:ASCH domain-containing protein [Caldanaerobacter subterraneus]NNG67755.1 ASCH domain-containing protein [Caldanaerobacter subterraneus]
MSQILLSIRPEYVESIFKGTKRFEYRKIKFARKEVNKILIYCTAPVMKVVGEAEILEIIEDTPPAVWEKTKDYAGIDKKVFDEYYKNKEKAVAYRLGNVKKYLKPIKLTDLGIRFVPQSFVYIES